MIIDPRDFRKIVVLTGAGISAESGISTFRDSGGLWEKHRIEDVATPEAFERDPHLVWRFYSLRRMHAARAVPNLAHQGLVQYAKATRNLTLVTQNVDYLHQRADEDHALPPLCMHGSLHESRCTRCSRIYADDQAYFDESGRPARISTGLLSPSQSPALKGDDLPLSPCCQSLLRPHIVWFGEMPLHMDEISEALEGCDLFVSIGTSGQVYPAAGFLQMAKLSGATTVCINKDPLPTRAFIDQFLEGTAGELVPKFFSP